MLLRRVGVLVGAPKANTSQPDIVQGGAVYHCAWPAAGCHQIPFDNTSKCRGSPPTSSPRSSRELRGKVRPALGTPRLG